MLARLSIRDIVLIDRLDIDFGSGLAALTGETGAGKSILLDAFALALGARGEAALVREGAEQGQVIAAFDIAKDHPARRVLADNDLGGEDELIVRRVQFADGRTRAFVNDQPVSVQVLRALGAALVEIHGQHDERAFVDAATHRALLDAYGGIEDDAAEVARLWTERRTREAAVDDHRAASSAPRAKPNGCAMPSTSSSRLAPANRRGNRAGRTPHRHDAGGKSRRGFARDATTASPARIRRCRRWRPRCAAWSAARRQAPTLIEPAVKAIDTALTALDEARTHLEQALRVAEYDPAGTGADRGASVRVARRGTQIQCAGR